MSTPISARTTVAGVVGSPISHSLSPTIHNAWIQAAGVDAVYVAFEPKSFSAFVQGLRGGAVRGLNVTAPFKAEALATADAASERARRAGAANLLVFELDGTIAADNTDGEGLLAAFAEQAPGFDPAAGPVVILGAGGAARGAAAAFLDAGSPVVRLVNRTQVKAERLAKELGGFVKTVGLDGMAPAFADAIAVINATTTSPDAALASAPRTAIVMDMVYRPLRTQLLRQAEDLGLGAVDGLAMLIGQARPSFRALFGVEPPELDVRQLVLAYLGEAA